MWKNMLCKSDEFIFIMAIIEWNSRNGTFRRTPRRIMWFWFWCFFIFCLSKSSINLPRAIARFTHFALFAQLVEGWVMTISFESFGLLILPQVLRFWVGVFTHSYFLSWASFPYVRLKREYEHSVVNRVWFYSVPGSIDLVLWDSACFWSTNFIITISLIYQLHHWATKYKA